jgi:acetyl-CoA carboxylase biotin carboxyl carrier protein
VPDPAAADARNARRDAAQRSADHAAIDRLSAELLPALIAKLGATGLGELEVREGAWRVRLRRPASGSGPTRERRPGERGADRSAADRSDRHADRPSRAQHHGPEAVTRSDARGVATSPAVGIYRPRTDLTVGDRVRSGDRLGAVDMLGVAQEVLAPMDGIVGSSLAETGDAVEYGQELLVIEALASAPAGALNTNGTGIDVP